MICNVIGVKTLYKRDIQRFLRVYNQTLISPIISALLFFLVFSVVVSPGAIMPGGVSYNAFLISGLVIMSAINNAYSNGAIIIVSKMTGNIIDLITAPFHPSEIVFALSMAAVTRSFMTCALVYFALCIWNMQFFMYNPVLMVVYLFLSSLVCALIGIISGLLSDSFDEAAIVTNYFITPLLFLSGTFYSIERIPPNFQRLVDFNPFFYMIDGFRYSLLGVQERPIERGLIVIVVLGAVLWYACHWILKSGYKIRK